MLTLHIEADSYSELMNKTETFFGMAINKPVAVLVTDQVAEKPAEPKKAGRPPKATAVQPPPADTAAPAPAPPAPVVNPFDDAPEVVPSKAVSLEDVRSALQEVAVKFPGEPGMDKVKAILAKFDTFKVSAVKPEKYQAVIDECKKA